jgi:hypothetical protein
MKNNRNSNAPQLTDEDLSIGFLALGAILNGVAIIFSLILCTRLIVPAALSVILAIDLWALSKANDKDLDSEPRPSAKPKPSKEEYPVADRLTHCKSCGAPLKGGTCEFCGTKWY